MLGRYRLLLVGTVDGTCTRISGGSLLRAMLAVQQGVDDDDMPLNKVCSLSTGTPKLLTTFAALESQCRRDVELT